MCTNFKVPIAEDGTVVVGRSLDYPADMDFDLCVIPRGLRLDALGSDGHVGRSWTAQHGVVGISAHSSATVIVDGMNTEGLSVHLLYMVGGFFHAAEFKGDGSDVSQLDLATYLLTTCASIDEVQESLTSINIWASSADLPFTPPIHVLVHDTRGSAAIEFQPSGVVLVENPTSVGTNSPYLDWHLLNLHNYVGFSNENPKAQRVRPRVGGMNIKPLGVGWGMRGIPGDYTGPSRFVRAIALTTLAETPRDSREAEMLALHILNTFDVPPGVVKEPGPDHEMVNEVTYADTIANLTGQRYAYRALDDPTVYVVDLAATDFEGTQARFLELSAAGEFTPVVI